MFAIEFRTIIKNGIIEIPKEYINQLKKNVKVIILVEENKKTTDMIAQLMKSPLKVEGFKPLTREEIY